MKDILFELLKNRKVDPGRMPIPRAIPGGLNVDHLRRPSRPPLPLPSKDWVIDEVKRNYDETKYRG